jgi:hypothetical protein
MSPPTRRARPPTAPPAKPARRLMASNLKQGKVKF